MSFESITHSPDFELPAHSPPFTADLLGLIEECHEGLFRIVIYKMIRRNKYEQICQIQVQEKGVGRKSHPPSSPEEIAEYCMLCMQYDVDRTDEPGKYKVTLQGAPGKGRFERSKHIDLSDSDGDPKSISMLSEGDLLEQQGSYISELHSQLIGLVELVLTNNKAIITENKEMMKIVSESQRSLADVEAQRLNHDLQLKMHNDEMEMKQASEEANQRNKERVIQAFEEAGAAEIIVKGVAKYMNKTFKDMGGEAEGGGDGSGENESQNQQARPLPETKKPPKRKGRKKKNQEEEISVQEEDVGVSDEQLEAQFLEEAQALMEKEPLKAAVDAFRESIDANDQWKVLDDNLSKEQRELFDKIFEAKTDERITRLLKQLYDTKGLKKLLKLGNYLNEDQEKIVDILIDVAAS